MRKSQPQGCLFVLLSLFGIKFNSPYFEEEEDLPYRLRDDFLSAAEFSFYRVLAGCLKNRAVILTKVSLADLFFVVRPHENQAYRNKIDRKHVDFLVCDPTTMHPLCGIELDDSSHARPDRQLRDEFVDDVFWTAGLPLVRVPVKRAYHSVELLALVEPYLDLITAEVVSTNQPSADSLPLCPKCGEPMVQRRARKGTRAGQRFFGCRNYPKCREIMN